MVKLTTLPNASNFLKLRKLYASRKKEQAFLSTGAIICILFNAELMEK